MENEVEHQKIMKKKTKESIEKFEITMLGIGMFTDFDQEMKLRKMKKYREERNET